MKKSSSLLSCQYINLKITELESQNWKSKNKITQQAPEVLLNFRMFACNRSLGRRCSFSSLSRYFAFGIGTIERIVKKCCQVIWTVLHNQYMPVPEKPVGYKYRVILKLFGIYPSALVPLTVRISALNNSLEVVPPFLI